MPRQITTRVEQWPLATPFRISRGVKTVAEVVTVAVTEDGVTGRGESVPYPRYGESGAGVAAQVAAIERAIADGAGRAELTALLPAGAARNAVDCALWDLEARRGGPSVSAVAGAPLPALVTALTVGLDSPEAMAAAAAKLADMPLIKVKVDAGDPETCLRAVRAAAPRPRMIVDPNESWDFALLQRLQPALAELRTEFVEQPLPAEADAALEGFAPLVPVCADESCHTVADLDRLAPRYGMINIKLDKAGGLTGALALYEAGRARGMGIMVGCMICTSLSIAPALHLAARADFADLDGPLWLKQDRPGGVAAEGGRLIAPAPGFWG
ncbi:N-acetyl-D-Glu racemase DgcA [Sphingomonas quercus]|uniref:Dipeptide epimerase n=1 Tax=Sphingomonas quercus TaxID=2842451 RepID=A0ABS6BP33_9SPHN|nr:dipeptide epimerase [Sphingomonas quercus]